MSRRQIDVCAARLPPREAAMFRAMLADADDLFRTSVRIRLKAWQMYRDSTGLQRRDKPRKARKT